MATLTVQLLCLLSACVYALQFTPGLAGWPTYEPSPYDYGIVQQASRRNNSHNLVVGWRQYGDRLLFRELVKKSFSFMSVVTEDLRYPPYGYTRKENITYVLALDQVTGGTGGYANLTSGGVGMSSVNIHFKSQRNRSIKFLVEIYGK